MNLVNLKELEGQRTLATVIYLLLPVGGFCLCNRCIYMCEECFLSPPPPPILVT